MVEPKDPEALFEILQPRGGKSNVPEYETIFQAWAWFCISTYIKYGGYREWLDLSNSAADSTRQLYEHPYTVHTEILKTQGNIIAIDRHMKDIALTTDSTADSTAVQELTVAIDGLEQDIFAAFDLLYERFRGDQALLDSALQAVRDWKVVRDEILHLENAGLKEQADALQKSAGGQSRFS